MKKAVRDLEDRIVQLEASPSNAKRAKLEAKAELLWLLEHLTEEESLELTRLMVSLRDGKVSADEMARRYGELRAKAAERASTQPPGLREEYKQKWIRAESLRTGGRPLTEAEGDELRALNRWFWDRSYLGNRPLSKVTSERR